MLDDSFFSLHKFPFPSTLSQHGLEQFSSIFSYALIPFVGQGAVRDRAPWAFEQEYQSQKN